MTMVYGVVLHFLFFLLLTRLLLDFAPSQLQWTSWYDFTFSRLPRVLLAGAFLFVIDVACMFFLHTMGKLETSRTAHADLVKGLTSALKSVNSEEQLPPKLL